MYVYMFSLLGCLYIYIYIYIYRYMYDNQTYFLFYMCIYIYIFTYIYTLLIPLYTYLYIPIHRYKSNIHSNRNHLSSPGVILSSLDFMTYCARCIIAILPPPVGLGLGLVHMIYLIMVVWVHQRVMNSQRSIPLLQSSPCHLSGATLDWHWMKLICHIGMCVYRCTYVYVCRYMCLGMYVNEYIYVYIFCVYILCIYLYKY